MNGVIMNTNQKLTLYMLVGVPGCGKSTWAAKMASDSLHHYSSDAIRAEIAGDENSQDKNHIVFQEMNKRILSDLKAGYSCIYDATNMNRKRRMNFLKNIPAGVHKSCVMFLTPPQTVIERDDKRSRSVGASVIDKFLRSFNCPYWYEGWDEIVPVVQEETFTLPLEKMVDFEQDNPHHHLSLGKHMEKTRDYCLMRGFNFEVESAAAYHDCGKYYTKKFENSRGEPSETAHYYGHENYGTYMFLLDAYLGNSIWKYGSFEKTLYISQLVNWHMRPFDVWTQPDVPKASDLKLLGEQMVRDLICLHEADAYAH